MASLFVNRETAGDSPPAHRKGWPEAFCECGLLLIWEVCSIVHFRNSLAYAELVQLHGLAGRCRVGHQGVSPNRVFIGSLLGEGLNEERRGDHG
jgi:transposase